MLNHEGAHPEHYEELCALAASGQISEAEFVELQDHLQECEQCRSAYTDFIDLLHYKLPLAEPEIIGSSKLTGFFSKNPSYRERFLAHARREGLAVLNTPKPDNRWQKLGIWLRLGFGYAQVATIAVVALLLSVGLLAYNVYQSNIRYMKLASDQSAMSTQTRQSSSTVPQESHVVAPAPIETVPAPAPALPSGAAPDDERAEQLAKVRLDRAAADARAKAVEDQLTKVASELDALRTQNEETRVSREELEKKLAEAERVANAVQNNLQEIRQARSKDSLTIATQDLEIQKLSEKLTEQTEILEQQTNLLEASRDVRDLMGARNFHIADVRDVDSKGKDQRSFGRVFYTEGKSTLIFYAFDLNDRNTAKRNASFQVWGKRGPAQSPTHSLGLFQIDDLKQNRWVLRFEDPRILAEIDEVFVTVEPPGGSARPTSRQFLNAYLDTNPNRQ